MLFITGEKYRKLASLTLCLLLLTAAVSSQETGGIIVPSPEPFSLNSYDVRHAAALLKRALLFEVRDERGARKTIAVKTIRIYISGYNEDGMLGRKIRYDIEVNGSPLDWDNSYIEYEGKMMNLRALFTYRNQYPPDNIQYFH